ncbi:MAG: TonB-dependent receptor [Bacteroidales bacterium]|nr:TonB-dependent receptor [Bacteroidales bacterium]
MAVVVFPIFIWGSVVMAQTVRGTVKDVLTGEPLPNASVIMLSSDEETNNKLATITDTNGMFKLTNIPMGRYNIEVSFVGYEPERVVEVLVAGTKEIMLNFKLRELITQLDGITVKPVINKSRSQNPTAIAGATMISVEEAERFAGSFDGIERVVKRYLCTTGSTDNAGISTHGNHPTATMFRIEGVEVTPPAHFYGIGSHGTGEVSVLHTNLLSNSDYYTSTPPAEMGNTLGGVMDISLRSGNTNTYEHSVKLSTLGLDFTSEGPLSKTKGSSYIISYRYGLSKLTNDLGLGIFEGDQADYHDLSFKLNFPINNSSNFSLWGIGILDKTYMNWNGWEEKWNTLYDQDDFKSKVNTMMGGVTYDKNLGNGWRWKTDFVTAYRYCEIEDRYAIYATDGQLLTEANHYTLTFAPATPFVQFDNETLWLTLATSIQKRFSSHYLLKFGSSIRYIDYYQDLQRAATIFTGVLLPVNNTDKNMEQIDAYATNNLRFGKWTFNAGLHLSGWTLSNDWTLQPRFSTEYKPKDNQTLAFGYGMTTRIESYDTYFATKENKELKPIRSHQFVLNYKWSPSASLTLKSEAWVEWQSSVPVSPTSTYSPLNRRMFYTTEALVNEGKGRNYGVSIGVEHYMTDGLYWLVNGALYKAEYRAIDKIWRPTLYDRGWTINVVGGKEWKIRKKNILSVNVAFTTMGGLRETPFDETVSAQLYASGIPYVAYDDKHAMKNHSSAIMDLSLNVSYRIHGKKVDQIIGCDFMNILAQKEPSQYYFNYNKQKPGTIKSCYSVPNISYAIIF